MRWMVMAATDLTKKSLNSQRCFETNATNLASEAEAKAEAARRNKAEKAAGHNNVEWYPAPQLDLAMMKDMLKFK